MRQDLRRLAFEQLFPLYLNDGVSERPIPGIEPSNETLYGRRRDATEFRSLGNPHIGIAGVVRGNVKHLGARMRATRHEERAEPAVMPSRRAICQTLAA